MRGETPSPQPLLFSLGPSLDHDVSGESKCAFCWNGECYTYSEDSTNQTDGSNSRAMLELISQTNAQDSYDQSDTVLVKNLLCRSITDVRQNTLLSASSNNDHEEIEHQAIASTMARIHGEYSFLLYVPASYANENQSPGCVYFGRDSLGRRSLLINRSVPGFIIISSVAAQFTKEEEQKEQKLSHADWEELPPGIVYKMEITGEVSSLPVSKIVNEEVHNILCSTADIDSKTYDKSAHTQMKIADDLSFDAAAKQLLYLLDKSIQRRVINAPQSKSQCESDASVAVLFSGGIDSVILAALCHRHVPYDKPIDLINVSFYDDSDSGSSVISPDRLAALLSFVEMATKWPKRHWRFITVDVSYSEVLEVESKVLHIISPLDSTMDFNISVAFWFAGRGKGCLISKEDANAIIKGNTNMSITTSKESTEPLLRFAKDKSTDPDSCNANEQSVLNQLSRKRLACIREGCTRPAPDRGCLFDSCKFCCGKLQSPISKFAGQHVQICPAHNRSSKRSVSAATGQSKLQLAPKGTPPNTVTSAAKILISGVGADEQMAGYGRHRTTFQRGGYNELKDELKMEVKRLWTRNLGRDDRCLSDCGKEARFPYLDEDVVAYLEALPLHLKCNLHLPQGVGDKMILREVARIIGVNECSALVKRAIQFGSRIAKVSDKKRFGSQRQAKGTTKHKMNSKVI